MFEITMKEHNYISKRLEKTETAIYKIADKMNSNLFEIAWKIARTAEEVTKEEFNADGFKDVHEWTEKAFGFKKAMSYNLLKIGNEFTSEIVYGKTKIYRDNITSQEEIGFTTSQIIQLLPYGQQTADEAHRAGYINPSMSCREINAAMKQYIKDDVDYTEESGEETETENADESANGEMIEVSDSTGERYMIPLKVLSKYRVED